MVHKVFNCEIAMTSPYTKIHQKAQGYQDVVVYGIGNKESHHFTTRPWRSIKLTLKGRISPSSMDGGVLWGHNFCWDATPCDYS